MQAIELSNSTVRAFVDDKFLFLRLFSWFLTKDGYVSRFDGKKQIYMHHEVIGYPPKGLETDHKNRIKYDNTSDNLRHVTHAQNMANKAPHSNATSRFLGVFLVKTSGRWRARIKKDNVIYHLGNHRSELAAARAYNIAALRLYGESATLNEIDLSDPVLKNSRDTGVCIV